MFRNSTAGLPAVIGRYSLVSGKVFADEVEVLHRLTSRAGKQA